MTCPCVNQQPYLRGLNLGAAAPAWTQDPSLVVGQHAIDGRMTVVVTKDVTDVYATFGAGSFTPGSLNKSGVFTPSGPAVRIDGPGFNPNAAPTGMRFNAKRDLTGAAVGFALPFLYEKAAPKKWPRNIGVSLALVAAGYFGSVFVYNKVTEA